MKTRNLFTAMVLITLVFAGCSSRPQVGELLTESHSVELGDAESVRVEIAMGAGELTVTGGAEKLLKSEFAYNVAEMKPIVEYSDGLLVVKHAEVKGPSSLQGITGYRNNWDLRLNQGVPMNLVVNMGAGSSTLKLSGMSLSGLDVTLGAGSGALDLSGNWARDLNVTVDTGAATVTVRLPKDVGVRVKVDAGASTVNASGLKQDGNVFTNDAYGVSSVTIEIVIKAGIGQINLEVEE